MMTRWCCALALVLGVLLPLASPANGQVAPGAAVDLQDTLEKGLRVRIDREREFITRVVDLVGQGVFQRSLVLTVMQKARFYHATFPFRYFRTMMQMLAEKRKIDLPF